MVVLLGAVADAPLDLQLQQWSGRTCRGIKQVRLGSAHCASRPNREDLKWGEAPGGDGSCALVMGTRVPKHEAFWQAPEVSRERKSAWAPTSCCVHPNSFSPPTSGKEDAFLCGASHTAEPGGDRYWGKEASPRRAVPRVGLIDPLIHTSSFRPGRAFGWDVGLADGWMDGWMTRRSASLASPWAWP